MIVYNIKTTYKSGFVKNDKIAAHFEDEMWGIYNAHHNLDKIETKTIDNQHFATNIARPCIL